VIQWRSEGRSGAVPGVRMSEENWASFHRDVNGQRAYHLVDLGLLERNVAQGLPLLIVASIEAQSPGDFDAAASGALVEFEDRLVASIEQRCAGKYVGRVRTSDRVTWHFHAPERAGIEGDVADAVRNAGRWTVNARCARDPQWRFCSGHLLPNEQELRFINDSKVVVALMEHGDPLDVPRNFRHYVYFDAEGAARACVGGIGAVGLRGASAAVDRSDDKYVVVVSHESPADPDSAHAAAEAIRALAARHGGEYDGWEAALVRARPKGWKFWKR